MRNGWCANVCFNTNSRGLYVTTYCAAYCGGRDELMLTFCGLLRKHLTTKQRLALQGLFKVETQWGEGFNTKIIWGDHTGPMWIFADVQEANEFCALFEQSRWGVK